MPGAGPGRIFVSHSHADRSLEGAIRELLGELFGDKVVVSSSSSAGAEGGIDSGADWLSRIKQMICECDVALVLLTTSSVRTPWIVWESAGVQFSEAGASSGNPAESPGERPEPVRGRPTRLHALVFQVPANEIPPTFTAQRLQFKRGDDVQDMNALMVQLLSEDFEHLFTKREAATASQFLVKGIPEYCQKVALALRTAPAQANEGVTQVWLDRIEELAEKKRYSELDQLDSWLRRAFGLKAGDKEWPIDFRIHCRLGEIHKAARNTEKAIEHFDLARRLAPRDLYVLRTLGQLRLDATRGESDKARLEEKRSEVAELIARIATIDPAAFATYPECAAFQGRFLEEGGKLSEAVEVYKAAVAVNPDSYYLHDKLGQAQLQQGEEEEAKKTYRRVLELLEQLSGRGEHNEWTLATASTAAIVLGNEAEVMKNLREIQARRPNPDIIGSITRGLRKVQSQLRLSDEVFDRWMKALQP